MESAELVICLCFVLNILGVYVIMSSKGTPRKMSGAKKIRMRLRNFFIVMMSLKLEVDEVLLVCTTVGDTPDDSIV